MARSTASVRKAKPAPRKRDAHTWVRKGRKHDGAGDEKKAMQCYLTAFNEDPNNLEALKLLSRKLIRLTERRMAIEVLEKAVQANPDDPEVYLILGNLALEMRMLEGALSLFTLVCQITPEDTSGPNNLATVLRELERYDEAIAVLQEAIQNFPTAAALWNTLATVVAARDGVEPSLTFYEEALRLDPGLANTWSNLAKGYEGMGRLQEAEEAARKAIEADPQLAEPHFVLATALLAQGNLADGWAEYEWRQHWRRPSSLRFALESKRWNGEPLDGESLVICPEQGLGDELLFATCVPDVKERTDQLYIGCDRRLVPLYQRSFPDAVVGGYRDVFHNAHRYRDLPFLREKGITPDRYIEVGSLFQHVRPTVDAFPDRPDGYLIPDPERVAHWQRELEALGPGPKVGIGWESAVRNNQRNQHYTALDTWRDILSVEGVTFVNLQYGDCEDQLAAAEAAFGLSIHRPRGIDLKNDLDELAALIKALDIVVCPTIAVSCMSLAVGTELWLLARKVPWWHLGKAGPMESTPIGRDRLFLHDVDEGWAKPTRELGNALKERV